MEDLYQWLRQQPSGVHTYENFCDKAAKLATSEPEQAAACKVLAAIAEHFVEEFDGRELPVDVASCAYERFVAVVGEVADSTSRSNEERINVLNKVSDIRLY